jgi:hypothetical protein
MFNKQIKELKKDKSLNKLTNMNIKLKQLVDSVEALSLLMGLKLPIVLGFKISLFVKKASPELDEYNKKRNELLGEYAEVVNDENGKPTGNMKFSDEDKAKTFSDKLNALLDQDVKVDVPEVSISEFSGLEIEPKYLVNLDWLIKQ